MIDVNDAVVYTNIPNIGILYVRIGQESITWGDNKFDLERSGEIKERWGTKCLIVPEHGFFKRPNERFVLPHAIGCQSPTQNQDYISILQGCV